MKAKVYSVTVALLFDRNPAGRDKSLEMNKPTCSVLYAWVLNTTVSTAAMATRRKWLDRLDDEIEDWSDADSVGMHVGSKFSQKSFNVDCNVLQWRRWRYSTDLLFLSINGHGLNTKHSWWWYLSLVQPSLYTTSSRLANSPLFPICCPG